MTIHPKVPLQFQEYNNLMKSHTLEGPIQRHPIEENPNKLGLLAIYQNLLSLKIQRIPLPPYIPH